VHDTWAARDLPVLDATVSLLDESYMVTVSDIAARTGLEPAAVARALEALDPDYLDFRKTTTGGDPTFWYVLKVTPQARRAVGQWPTADSFVTRLAAELSAAAAQEDDTERKGLLSYAARLIGDSLRDVAVRAAGQVLAPATEPPPARRTPPGETLPFAEAALAASRASAASGGGESPAGAGPAAAPGAGEDPEPAGEAAPSADADAGAGAGAG
jgi:hypothetical protein